METLKLTEKERNLSNMGVFSLLFTPSLEMFFSDLLIGLFLPSVTEPP